MQALFQTFHLSQPDIEHHHFVALRLLGTYLATEWEGLQRISTQPNHARAVRLLFTAL
jgi:hypothetical protein